MTSAQVLHRHAMELAEKAHIARRMGDEEEATRLFSAAFEQERDAASHFVNDVSLEPTRSVLYRSAAWLALSIGDTREAERAIASALVGNPPLEIVEELRDLMERVNFQRHLDLRGVRLQPDEFQFSIEGDGVGLGIAPAGQFISRVRDIETLLYRTAERKLDRPFREGGRRRKSLDESLQLFVSIPRAASFAVTFRLGSTEQMEFPETSFPAELVSEVLECFTLLNRGDLERLETRIDNEPYYRNFLALAQKVAPDGKIVRTVGFTAVSGETEHRVALTATRAEIVPKRKARPPSTGMLITSPNSEDSSLVEITGTLLEADAKDAERGRIQVRTESGTLERIQVPRGMMRDIVKPYFEEEVVVTCLRFGGDAHLETIRGVDE